MVNWLCLVKLITTSQRILQHFVIISQNIQRVRGPKRRHNLHEQLSGWIHYFQAHAIYFCMGNSLFHLPVEQNLASRKAGCATGLYTVRRLYFHYIAIFLLHYRPQETMTLSQQGMSAQNTTALLSGRLEVTQATEHKWEGRSTR